MKMRLSEMFLSHMLFYICLRLTTILCLTTVQPDISVKAAAVPPLKVRDTNTIGQ